MPSIVFPYTTYRGKSVPIIPVELAIKDKRFAINAYVDSGAFYSIFGSEVADLLEIPLTAGLKRMAIVGDGSFIPFYMHRVCLRIGNSPEIIMPVGFSEKLGVGFNILGLDLFDYFMVVFNNRRKTVSFKQFW